MTTRISDLAWDKKLTDVLRADSSELRVICPYTKAETLQRLLAVRDLALCLPSRRSPELDQYLWSVELRRG